jgi:hypothetical protein
MQIAIRIPYPRIIEKLLKRVNHPKISFTLAATAWPDWEIEARRAIYEEGKGTKLGLVTDLGAE